jgi:hypothetical protein
MIVGAWGVTLNDKIDIGKSYVIFGKTNSSAINLSVLAKIYLQLARHLGRPDERQ